MAWILLMLWFGCLSTQSTLYRMIQSDCSNMMLWTLNFMGFMYSLLNDESKVLVNKTMEQDPVYKEIDKICKVLDGEEDD